MPRYQKLLLILALSVVPVVGGCDQLQRQLGGGDILTSGEKLYSQGNEELVIRDFFGDSRGGVFVDVGSGDYKEMSTTYYLENHLEWSGIGVDALPEYAEGYERHRPATKFLNYIVTDHAGTTEPFYKVESMRELSATDEKLARQFGPVEVIEVPTITLTDLLDRNGISRIDLLSMDIEESEPEALAGFDIDRFKPRLVCIEAHPSVQEQILEYFDRRGYERIDEYLEHDELNWYFRPEGDSS